MTQEHPAATSEKDELVLVIIKKVVEKLAQDWQKNPCYWPQEIDIQAELRGRLDTALTLLGLNEAVWEDKESGEFKVTRVVCEPSWRINKGGSFIPDVVVWGEKRRPEIKDSDEPALWVCEIKYDTSNGGEDVEKLRTMFNRIWMRNGCALVFRNGEVNTPTWEQINENCKLEKYIVVADRNKC